MPVYPATRHPQRSTWSQSLLGRAGRDTIGLPFLPNWKVNQQMRSTFFVFDLVGRNTGLMTRGSTHGFIHPEFDDGEEGVGLVVREQS
jgi:hypothetical protein